MASNEGVVAPGAGDVAREETPRLIAAQKVNGTPVYHLGGDRLGTIQDLMLDKQSGRVAYAVMSFGGFLGIGERYHPLPWSVLTYSVDQGGYSVDLDPDRLDGAPSFAADENPDWSSPDWGRRVHDYYGIRPYWDRPA